MKIKATLILTGIILCTVTVCFGRSSIKPNGERGEVIDRHLHGFTSIELSGPFDIYLSQGNLESVKVDAPSDVSARIITEVVNGALKVYTKHDHMDWGNWWGNHKRITVYVMIKNLNSLYLSGSGDDFFKDGLSLNTLKLAISGSGDITGQITANSLECSISGSGDMRLSGHAETLTVTVGGSGDFTARNLKTVNSTVRVSGSGDAEINASRKIDAAVSGSGDIRYTGGAKVASSKSGSGDISGF